MIQSGTARFEKHARTLRGWTSCGQFSYGLLGELKKQRRQTGGRGAPSQRSGDLRTHASHIKAPAGGGGY